MALSPAPLPFRHDALEPFISTRTLEYHYDKHYLGYVQKLQAQIRNTPLAAANLTEIVRTAWKTGNLPVFNNAAQAWNHEFYFASLCPEWVAPSGPIASLIERDFGGLEAMLKILNATALAHFGSGWVWLVLDRETLRIVSTANADSPLLYARQTPLLAIDVWEHAYYLDYQSDRKGHVEAVTSRLLNWSIVGHRLKSSLSARETGKLR